MGGVGGRNEKGADTKGKVLVSHSPQFSQVGTPGRKVPRAHMGWEGGQLPALPTMLMPLTFLSPLLACSRGITHPSFPFPQFDPHLHPLLPQASHTQLQAMEHLEAAERAHTEAETEKVTARPRVSACQAEREARPKGRQDSAWEEDGVRVGEATRTSLCPPGHHKAL